MPTHDHLAGATVRDVPVALLMPPCADCQDITAAVGWSPLDRLAGRAPRALCARHHLAELFSLLEMARQRDANNDCQKLPRERDMTKDTTTSAPAVITTCPRCGEPVGGVGVRRPITSWSGYGGPDSIPAGVVSLYSDELLCLACAQAEDDREALQDQIDSHPAARR